MVTTASWYHLSVKPVSRSAGRSAVAAAAYRLGARIEDERAQLVHDYRARSGVEVSFTVAPVDAPGWALVPERLWNAAEIAERRVNSTLAREVELALPAAVDPDARRAITEAFAAELVERYGVAVSVAIHRPSRDGDDRNHHAHILFTTREMTPTGLGAKTRVLDDRTTGPKEVIHLRALACDLINEALEDAGSDERVDHRSFEARGIDQEATQHLGPSASEMERRGATTDRGDENRAVQERNAERRELDSLVAELAELDAEIYREQMAELEAGDADPRDLLTQSVADRPAEHGDLGRSDRPSDDFAAIHAETMRQAEIEHDAMRSEYAAGDMRFDRLRAWWHNMVEHFVDWRDQLIERAIAFGIHWFTSGDEQRHGQPDSARDHGEHDR